MDGRKAFAAIVSVTTMLAPGRVALAADYAAATNCLVQTVLKSPLAPATLSGTRVPVADADSELVIAGAGSVLEPGYERYWVFEVDAEPFAFRLVHDRRLVVMSEDLAFYQIHPTRNPAMLRDRHTGRARGLETLNDESVPRATGARTAATRGTAANGGSAPLANTENNTNLHVVLISGGYNPYNNGIRFFFDIRNAYQVLREQCQVPRTNIHTFVASGVESNSEHQFGWSYVAVDYDLDGDGVRDVNGGASRTAVGNCLNTLAAGLTERDRLLIVFSSHGSRNDSDFRSWTTQACLWYEFVSDAEFREWTKDFKCPVAFVLQPCFSGGFADDLVREPQRVVGTAANHLESSWGFSDEAEANNYNLYLHNFFGAIASGEATDFYTAASSAYAEDNLLAHPQYAESSPHLGYQFRFDALTAPSTNYDRAAFDFADAGAIGLTTNFDYRSEGDAIWRPDVFSASGFHTGWTRLPESEDETATYAANWVTFASGELKTLSGLEGALAMELGVGSSRRFSWTAPGNATMRFSLAGSYGSADLSVTLDGEEVIADAADSHWAGVSFEATKGKTYEIAVSANVTMLTALLEWSDDGVLYVDASRGDDGNDGRDSDRPLGSIQRAIELANAGDRIEVARGRYAPITSWNQSLYIRATDGPLVTFIDGGGTNCCANLCYSQFSDCETLLEGFTLENGFDSGVPAGGAGIRGGTVIRSIIRNCRAKSPQCVTGVAAYYGVLENCLICGNTAVSSGSVTGGVCFASELYNCTVADNRVAAAGNVFGGGLYIETEESWYGATYLGAAVNSLIVGTTVSAAATVGLNACDTSGGRLVKTLTGGDPGFVDRSGGDYRLSADSPAVDAGYSDGAESGVDLAGAPRLQGGDVDLGCYESSYTAADPVVPAVTPTRGGRHYGVYVGINRYQAANGLNGCVHDAESLRERCLRSGLWHEEDTVIHTNQFATESAVRETIAALSAVAAAGDTVIICHSGHGNTLPDEQMSGQLCMYDYGVGAEGCDGSYFDYELAADLLQFDEGVKILVYLDACRSAAMFKSWASVNSVASGVSTASATRFPQRVRAAMTTLSEGPTVRSAALLAGARVSSGTSLSADVATNVAFITAADYDQYSWDSLETTGGEFTLAFTAGWTNGLAETSGDGKLDFHELYAYAANIATGVWICVDYRTEPQCDNATLLSGMLAGYASGVWPEPEIAAGDTPEQKVAKLRDAMIGAGFSSEYAAAVTNEADYAALVKWARYRDYTASEVAASPAAFLSPALDAVELLNGLTEAEVQLTDFTSVEAATPSWRCSLALPDYHPARVNESLLRLAVGLVGARKPDGGFSAAELDYAVKKGETAVEVTVTPPDDAPEFFIKATVR